MFSNRNVRVTRIEKADQKEVCSVPAGESAAMILRERSFLLQKVVVVLCLLAPSYSAVIYIGAVFYREEVVC